MSTCNHVEGSKPFNLQLLQIRMVQELVFHAKRPGAREVDLMIMVPFFPFGIRKLPILRCNGKDHVENSQPFVPWLQRRLTEEDLEL